TRTSDQIAPSSMRLLPYLLRLLVRVCHRRYIVVSKSLRRREILATTPLLLIFGRALADRAPRASIPEAGSQICQQPAWSLSAKTEVRFLFFSFFEAKPRSDSPSDIPVGTGLSSEERKIGADKVVPSVPVRILFLRYQVRRLMPISSHGCVADKDADCGRIPSARRMRSLRSRALRWRRTLRARFLTLVLPMVVSRRAC